MTKTSAPNRTTRQLESYCVPEKTARLAEYALAGMNNELFVSKYQMELPSKEALQQEIEAERLRLAGEFEKETESQ